MAFGTSHELSTRLRMGITGASCTGKTTLASALAERLDLPLAIEGAREAAAAVDITHSQDVSVANSREFQRFVLDIKIEAERRTAGGYVSDRTVIDCAAFW